MKINLIKWFIMVSLLSFFIFDIGLIQVKAIEEVSYDRLEVPLYVNKSENLAIKIEGLKIRESYNPYEVIVFFYKDGIAKETLKMTLEDSGYSYTLNKKVSSLSIYEDDVIDVVIQYKESFGSLGKTFFSKRIFLREEPVLTNKGSSEHNVSYKNTEEIALAYEVTMKEESEKIELIIRENGKEKHVYESNGVNKRAIFNVMFSVNNREDGEYLLEIVARRSTDSFESNTSNIKLIIDNESPIMIQQTKFTDIVEGPRTITYSLTDNISGLSEFCDLFSGSCESISGSNIEKNVEVPNGNEIIYNLIDKAGNITEFIFKEDNLKNRMDVYPSSLKLSVGKYKIQLSTYIGSEMIIPEYEYDSTLVNITSSGEVEGVNEGTTEIIVRYGLIEKKIPVTIEDVNPVSLLLIPSGSIDMYEGQEIPLNSWLVYENGYISKDNKEVKFFVDNNNLKLKDGNILEALSIGLSKIRAEYKLKGDDKLVSDETMVIILPDSTAGIGFDVSDIVIMEKGSNIDITVFEKRFNKKDISITSKILETDWSISDPNVVELGHLHGEKQNIIAKNSGLSLIEVKYLEKYSYRILVYVKKEPLSKPVDIVVNIDENLSIGEQVLSEVFLSYEDGSTKNVTLNSDYEVLFGKQSLIKGNSIGSFKGIHEGDAVVKVSYGEFSKELRLTVTNPVVDIYMIPEEKTVYDNQIISFKVNVLYKNGSTKELDYRDSVHWEYSDRTLIEKLDTLDGKFKIATLPDNITESNVSISVFWNGFESFGNLRIVKNPNLNIEEGSELQKKDTICITNWKFD